MKPPKIKLTPEQKCALDQMLSGKNVFLTGRAGTGKSTLVHEFKEKCNRECVFVAPTGIAAINIDGTTIHSLFQLKPGLITQDSIDNTLSKKRIELIRSIETIVIDEISMVRSDLFVGMDIRLKEVTGCNKPFGGKQLVLVGDFMQLPPVVKDRAESDYLMSELGGYYAFQTDLWQEADLQHVCLQKIHRQQDDALFMNVLNHLRFSDLNTRDIQIDGQALNVIEILNKFCVEAAPLEQTPVYLCTTNRSADTLNQIFQDKIESEVHVFRAVVRGKYPEGDYPTLETLALKVGARVMTLANKRTGDGEIEYVNGEIGVIEAIDDGDENAVVHVRLDRGPIVSVQRTKWSKPDYSLELDSNTGRKVVRQHEVGSFVQIPLKLSYASTIHKSQGLTFDRVEVKLGNGCFASGQLYTALSRCRSIKNLRIDRPICPADAIVDQDVVEFYRSIEAGLQPKRKRRDVALNIRAEDEDAVRAFLAELHGVTNRFVLPPDGMSEAPRHVDDHEDLVDVDTPLLESEDQAPDEDQDPEEEQDPEEKRISKSPDIDHLLVVYRNQNGDEILEKRTKRLNSIGFNKYDAAILTEIAEDYLAHGYLTEDEVAMVHHRIAKYHRQWE